MRDEMKKLIANIIWEHETGGVDHKGAADAIIAALPDMIEPLVWQPIEEDRGDGSSDETGEFESGPYYIEMGFGTDSYVWSVVYLSDDVSHGHDCPDRAKAAANAHHRAAIMEAFGVLL